MPLLRDVLFFPSALMQLARANSERLMFAPSRSLCPVFSVSDARSTPAKSTSESLPRLCTPTYPPALVPHDVDLEGTACDRLLVAFGLSRFRLAPRVPLAQELHHVVAVRHLHALQPRHDGAALGVVPKFNDGFEHVASASRSPPSPSRS